MYTGNPSIEFDPKNQLVLQKLKAGFFDSPDSFKLKSAAEQISLIDSIKKFKSLDSVKVKLYEHQLDTAFTAINKMKGIAMLADEVGLGKTIEAGIVLKEYIVRGLAKKVLILVPASLVTQWQQELKAKFNEDFITNEEFKGAGGWRRFDKIISSIDTAKQGLIKKQLGDGTETIELAYGSNAFEICNKEWDILIIDEAHKLKNDETANYQFVKRIPKKFLLTLTATPLQNNLRELYNMINLIKPGVLGAYSSFEANFFGSQDGRAVVNPEQLREVLRSIMIRNRRLDTNLTFPDRSVSTAYIDLFPEELELYAAVEDFIVEEYSEKNKFVLMLMQRLVTSSTFAIKKTLNGMLDSLEMGRDFEIKEDDLEGKISGEEIKRVIKNVDKLKQIYAMAEKIKENAKGKKVVEIIKSVKDKVLVFSCFRETQKYIVRELEKANIKTEIFNGSMSSKQKDAAVKNFEEKVQVLVSTEAGGEGRNLQFCDTMINYDLPWNPMKVEQRIGRIHRIGQKSPVVNIVNFSSQKTVEEYILELLLRKIDLFNQVVGEVDMIISDPKAFEEQIMRAIIKNKAKPKMGKAFEEIVYTVEQSKKLREKAKHFSAETLERFDLTPIYKYKDRADFE